MRIDEIEARLAAIRETVETRAAELSDEEVDALTEESRKLNAERKESEERAAKEAELRKAVMLCVGGGAVSFAGQSRSKYAILKETDWENR